MTGRRPTASLHPSGGPGCLKWICFCLLSAVCLRDRRHGLMEQKKSQIKVIIFPRILLLLLVNECLAPNGEKNTAFIQ